MDVYLVIYERDGLEGRGPEEAKPRRQFAYLVDREGLREVEAEFQKRLDIEKNPRFFILDSDAGDFSVYDFGRTLFESMIEELPR